MIDCLVIVDMQNDFMPGGPLGVAEARDLIPQINAIHKDYAAVCATLDAHQPKHYSFASTYGLPAFTQRGADVLWPDHCVVDTQGMQLVEGLKVPEKQFLKGQKETNGYSVDENVEFQRFMAVQKAVDFCGVALDYCVKASAMDTKKRFPHMRVRVLAKLCRSVDPATTQTSIQQLLAAGVEVVE